MPDALIFEDDPSVGDMVSDLCRGKGLTVAHYLGASGVVSIVQENAPRLVVLDIMMPGMDGLSACHAIRSNPATRRVKIVILTSKTSRVDKETAKRYGADLYFTKPFDVGEFARAVGLLLGYPQDPAAALTAKPPAPPVTATLLPGGMALAAPGLWVLCDMGPGMGEWLAAQGVPPRQAWILLSRYDAGATAELEAGALLLAAGAQVRLAGPDSPDAHLQRLAPRMCRGSGTGRALPLLHPQREGEAALAPGVTAVCRYTLHPGSAMAYRLEFQGRRVVYCPAHEVNPESRQWKSHEMEKFRDLFSGADLLVHGFRRSQSDPRADDGLGTGAWEHAADLACESGVKQLLLMPLPGAVGAEGLAHRLAERLSGRQGAPQAAVAQGVQRVVL